jgi:hypothetical protein
MVVVPLNTTTTTATAADNDIYDDDNINSKNTLSMVTIAVNMVSEQ